VPSLLSIAGSLQSYIPSFPPAPTATFALLRKLDHVFVSLLRGRDSVTGEGLPGLNSRNALTRTDMVRLRSLVERSRIVVVDVMRGAEDDGEASDSDDEFERVIEVDVDMKDEVGRGIDMEVAKVYAGTLKVLGLLIPEVPAFDIGGGQS
jgi:hypothetical protein